MILALLLQIAVALAPFGEPTVPEFVIVYAEWNDCSFITSVSKCEVGWVPASDTAKDQSELGEKLVLSWVPDYRSNRYSFHNRRFIGVWSLKTGKKVEIVVETRERSEPERIEARKWIEKRWVIKP
jgi:hypothetical protein